DQNPGVMFTGFTKNLCQLEGSDHGGRDTAAELALAGVFDVHVERSFNRLALVSAHSTHRIILLEKCPSMSFFSQARARFQAYVNPEYLCGFFGFLWEHSPREGLDFSSTCHLAPQARDVHSLAANIEYNRRVKWRQLAPFGEVRSKPSDDYKYAVPTALFR